MRDFIIMVLAVCVTVLIIHLVIIESEINKLKHTCSEAESVSTDQINQINENLSQIYSRLDALADAVGYHWVEEQDNKVEAHYEKGKRLRGETITCYPPIECPVILTSRTETDLSQQ